MRTSLAVSCQVTVFLAIVASGALASVPVAASVSSVLAVVASGPIPGVLTIPGHVPEPAALVAFDISVASSVSVVPFSSSLL